MSGTQIKKVNGSTYNKKKRMNITKLKDTLMVIVNAVIALATIWL